VSLNFDRELDTAIAAVRGAGSLLRMHFERGVQAHTKSTPFDLVTEADKASETVIVETLTDALPDHRIIAEEGGGNRMESEYVWLVDPLDGTTNMRAAPRSIGLRWQQDGWMATGSSNSNLGTRPPERCSWPKLKVA